MEAILIKKIIKKIIKNIFFKYNQFDYPYREYFNLYKCLFIHIPKTAGTSILKIISDDQFYRDHCKYKILLDSDAKKFDSYYKFCFIRNPFDRMVSIYNYLQSNGNGLDDVYWGELLKNNYPNFEDFVLHFLNERNIHEHTIFIPQYLFIYNHKHECMVDFVGRYESINDDYKIIAKNLQLKETLPHLNKSKTNSPNYKKYYTNPKIIEKIIDLYRKDFELLGYDPSL